MSQNTSKYILKKCENCGEYFTLNRYGKQLDLCKQCRKVIYRQNAKDKVFIRQQAANKAAARRRRNEFLAERDTKAPLVTIKIKTRRNSLGATIVCEQRGNVPGGTWCMRRY